MKVKMSEAIVNIGIILGADARQRLTVILPQQRRYLWEIAGKCHELAAGARYTVSIAATGIRLEHGDRPIAIGDGPAVLRAADGDYSFPNNQCPLVEDIPVGRSFHWRKQIDQLLPGHLQFVRVGTALVLSNRLPLEIYLQGVVSAEMNANCPLALLQAQMVVARSWLLAAVENKHPGLDCCNDDCCQRYQGIASVNATVADASRTTWGQVLCFGDSVCDTRYSKCCGGITEQADHIWPDAGQPYLQSLVDAADTTLVNFDPGSDEAQLRQWLLAAPPCFCNPNTLASDELQCYLGRVDEPGSYFRWQQYYSHQQLATLLREKLCLIDLDRLLSLHPGARGNRDVLSSLPLAIAANKAGANNIISTANMLSETLSTLHSCIVRHL